MGLLEKVLLEMGLLEKVLLEKGFLEKVWLEKVSAAGCGDLNVQRQRSAGKQR
jgi:hypothetical protein